VADTLSTTTKRLLQASVAATGLDQFGAIANESTESLFDKWVSLLSVKLPKPSIGDIEGLEEAIAGAAILDPDLQSIGGLEGKGFPARTSANLWKLRKFVPPVAGLTLSHPLGELGNPTFSLANDLLALENLASTGLAVRTAADTWAQRSLVQPAFGVTITNPAGIAGDPTFALANDLLALENLASTGLAVRTAADTWAQRTLVPPAFGVTIANPAGVAGDPTFSLANDLLALENLASTGLAVRTAADTWAQRTIQGTANQVIVANGAGVAGDPVLSLPQNIDTSATPQFARLGIGVAAHASDPLTIGASALRLTAAGNLLIGTTSESAIVTNGGFNAVGDGMLAGNLSVINTTYVGPAGFQDRGITVQREGGDAGVMMVTANNTASAGGQILGARARGTLASKTAVLSGDMLLSIYGSAYDGTDWFFPVNFAFEAAENHSATNKGTRLSFNTTLVGGTTNATRAQVSGNGNLLVGTTSEVGLSGSGNLRVLNTILGGRLNISDALGTALAAAAILNTSAAAVGNLAITNYTFVAGVHGDFGMVQTSAAGAGQGAFRWSTFNGTAFAERMRLSSAGDLAVGTDSPTVLRTRNFEISSPGTNDGAALIVNKRGTGIATVRLATVGAASGFDINFNFPTTGGLGFFDLAASVNRMVVSAAGNLLIGTTSETGLTGAGNLTAATTVGRDNLWAGDITSFYASSKGQIHARGSGQTAAAFNTFGALGSALVLQDAGGGVGNGGAVVFGANPGAFAAIKGFITDGSNNTLGHLLVATRRISSDATLTESARFTLAGNLLVGSTVETGLTGAGNLRVQNKLLVDAGITANSGGIKHSRVTTGSIAGASTALVTVTWGTAFADDSYTVLASVQDSTATSLSLSVVHVETKSATQVQVRVLNNAAGALTGTLQILAVHD